MSLPQQKFREIVFQLLYSQDIGHSTPADMIPLIMKELSVTKKVVREAVDKMLLIKEKLDDIDAIIEKTSVSYAFERIQSVERNILRVGVYELLYAITIPPKVAIAESMRLARKFGSPESAAFVNAILDNVYKASQGVKIDTDTIRESVQALIKFEEVAHEASKAKPLEEDESNEP